MVEAIETRTNNRNFRNRRFERKDRGEQVVRVSPSSLSLGGAEPSARNGTWPNLAEEAAESPALESPLEDGSSTVQAAWKDAVVDPSNTGATQQEALLCCGASSDAGGGGGVEEDSFADSHEVASGGTQAEFAGGSAPPASDPHLSAAAGETAPAAAAAGSNGTITTPPPGAVAKEAAVAGHGAWTAARVVDAGVPVAQAEAVLALAAAVGVEDRWGVAEPLCDPLTLLRFLDARGGADVGAAAAMWRGTVAWRRDFGVGALMAGFGDGARYDPASGCLEPALRAAEGAPAAPAVQHAAPPRVEFLFQRSAKGAGASLGVRCGFAHLLAEPSETGEPVAVWRLGLVDWAGFAREGLEGLLAAAFVAHLEEVLQRGRAASAEARSLVRCRLVIDGAGLGLGSLAHLPLLQRVTALGKAYFPEVSATVTVVNAPWAFAALFSAASSLLTPVMHAKVAVLDGAFATDGGAGLRAHAGIHVAALPEALGGKLPDKDCPLPEQVPVGVGSELAAEAARWLLSPPVPPSM